jgi:hypothetical protein
MRWIWRHAWSVRGPNRGRGQFLNFVGVPMNAKSVAVNASSRWLNNVTDVVLSPGFLAFN